MAELANEYKISAVTLGDQWIEIAYYETKDVSEDVVDLKQRMINPRKFPDQVQALTLLLGELLDEAAILRRNPPPSFTAPRRTEDEPRVSSDDLTHRGEE